MKYKSINYLNDYLNDIMNNECNNIIEQVCKKYNLNIDEIKNEIYNKNFIENNKSKINNIINKYIRCLGLIKSGCQCLRSRQNGYNYCKIHQKTLKFGKKFMY